MGTIHGLCLVILNISIWMKTPLDCQLHVKNSLSDRLETLNSRRRQFTSPGISGGCTGGAPAPPKANNYTQNTVAKTLIHH